MHHQINIFGAINIFKSHDNEGDKKPVCQNTQKNDDIKIGIKMIMGNCQISTREVVDDVILLFDSCQLYWIFWQKCVVAKTKELMN